MTIYQKDTCYVMVQDLKIASYLEKEGYVVMDDLKVFEGDGHKIMVAARLGSCSFPVVKINTVQEIITPKKGIEVLFKAPIKPIEDSFYSQENLVKAVEKGQAYFLNVDHGQWHEILEQNAQEKAVAKKRVNILGLGDVGSTMAIGMLLYGQETLSEIGIFDLDENRMARWEQELNQIVEPIGKTFPKIRCLTQETLFDCDLFAFTASVGVPPVNVTKGDVRLIQYQGNGKMVEYYGQLAAEKGFTGIFAVVSDPVDLLCRRVYEGTNRDEGGVFNGLGLRPEQIRGYGLGVMNGRAHYFANQEGISFENGRVYGPHGKGLVVANDYREGHYEAVLSEKLSHLTVTANLKMREIGYKPYVAPAIASGALAIVKTLSGEWHYSCIPIDGVYYGCLNRRLEGWDEYECLEIDLELAGQIRASYEELNRQWQNL